jgi:hypothetical protein
VQQNQPGFAGILVPLMAIVLQACVFSSEQPLIDQGRTVQIFPLAFTATEFRQQDETNRSSGDLQIYKGQYTDGKYRLVRHDDGAIVDVWFADIGDANLLMMMAWHIDEDTPYMYLTVRHQPPYLVFDDPSHLADNIAAYQRQNGDDIELVRDGSKFNDSLKIESLESVRSSVYL